MYSYQKTDADSAQESKFSDGVYTNMMIYILQGFSYAYSMDIL